MVDIIFREARSEDLEAIGELENKIFGVDAYSIDVIIGLYENADFFIVAESRGKIVGYIIGEIKGRYGHILTIAVEDEYRRRGIGTKMLQLFIEYSIKKGVREVYLEVSTQNSIAINFYKRFGFEIKGFIPRYYRSGDDAYIMIKKIG